MREIRSLSPKNTSNTLSRNRVIRFILIGVLSITASALSIVVIVGIAVSVVGYIYDINHVIPDPVIRGDDFGYGLIMVITTLCSLLVSLPVVVLIHIYFFKRLFIRSSRDE